MRLGASVPIGDDQIMLGITGRKQDYTRIQAITEPGVLVIALQEKNLIKDFIDHRPETVTFQRATPGINIVHKTVRVTYALDDL